MVNGADWELEKTGGTLIVDADFVNVQVWYSMFISVAWFKKKVLLTTLLIWLAKKFEIVDSLDSHGRNDEDHGVRYYVQDILVADQDGDKR